MPAATIAKANIGAIDALLEVLEEVRCSRGTVRERLDLIKEIAAELAPYTMLRSSDRNATYELVARHVQSAIAKLQGDPRPNYATGPGRVPDEFIMEEAEKARERLAAKKAAGK